MGALIGGLIIAGITWKIIGPAKSIALGVATYLILYGVGVAILWFRMARYSARYFLRNIASPVFEMVVLGWGVSNLLLLMINGRIGLVANMLGFILFLVLYGISRAYSKDELKSLWGRIFALSNSA